MAWVGKARRRAGPTDVVSDFIATARWRQALEKIMTMVIVGVERERALDAMWLQFARIE